MKSIERRLLMWEEKRPNVGRLLNLGKAVEGQRFSRQRISRALTQFIDLEDYDRSERRDILDHLYRLSWGLKRTENEGETAQEGPGEEHNDTDTV